MIVTTSKSNFDNNHYRPTFQEFAKPKLSQLRNTPEQQKTPTASPIMEKPDLKQDNTKITVNNDDDDDDRNDSTISPDPNPISNNTKNLQNLLGPSFNSWNYSESSLIHAINLKLEQEKTKQEYYRLESTNRSLELLKHSILARVPPNLIPLIFAGQNMNQETLDLYMKQFNEPQQQPVQQPLQQDKTHIRSQTIATPQELPKKQRDEFATPPMPTNFKFGGQDSNVTTPSSIQQNPPMFLSTETPPRNRSRNSSRLSPAKLGAQAVASLNNKFKSNLLQQHHQRTTSLPPQVSIPESSVMAFHKEETKPLPKLPVVKNPIPNNNKPVILQHQLIQFHHWTPGEGESSPNKKRRASTDSSSDDKIAIELKTDNNVERRKFITSHNRTRSDSSLFYNDQSSSDHKLNPPKYPNILSNE